MRHFLRFHLFFWLFLCLPLSLQAYDDTPKCFKDIESNFFNYTLVTQAISLYQVPQSGWELVYQTLERKSLEIPQILKQKARKMKPNPFQNPFNGKVVRDLLYETCYEIFVESLKESNVASPLYAYDMFEYIKNRNKGRVDACLGIEEEPKE